MLKLKRRRESRGRLKGVSLIEVLISIVIATIGLLALVGTTVSSARYTKMSQYRATATQLASDLGERMRANKDGFASYDMQTNFAGQAALPAEPGIVCYSKPALPWPAACSAADMAAYDLWAWRTVVRDQLPEGSAFIVFLNVQNVQRAADVWLVWRDPAVANADDAPTTNLECHAALSVAAQADVRCSYFRINL